MDAALTAEEEALREDLAEVRMDRDAVQALHADALELLRAARAEIDAAWQATGVASTVRGLTTLADVVTTLRESAAELRAERSAAVEALRQRGHDGDEESGQCDDDCARCAIEGALAHAASAARGER